MTQGGAQPFRAAGQGTIAQALRDEVAFIDSYFNETTEILNRVDRKPIADAIEILFDAWQRRRTVFVMGNGGSASTATHFASDLAKFTASPGKARFRAFCLNDNVPLMSALTNDEGWAAVYTEQLKPWLSAGDVIVGFSVHGGSGHGNAGAWSQNLLAAMSLAKERDARVIGIAGDTGGVMRDLADACIVVPVVNPERITVHTEGLHLVIHHLICDRLRQLIGQT